MFNIFFVIFYILFVFLVLVFVNISEVVVSVTVPMICLNGLFVPAYSLGNVILVFIDDGCVIIGTMVFGIQLNAFGIINNCITILTHLIICNPY